MNQTIPYFILAFILSWSIYIPLALNAQGIISSVPGWLHIFGAYGPLFAAFILTAARERKAGLRELTGRIARWRIGPFWLGIALSPVVIFLATATILRWVEGDWTSISGFGTITELPGVHGLAGWFTWILTFGLGEETGWRGYALPRLQKSYSARKASLVLGAFWAAWHIPVFYYNYEPSPFGVIAFTVGILSGSALLTWLYNSTGGSVLATILWHGTYNAAVAGSEGVIPVVVTATVILAVIFIANRYGPETFSHREKQTLP